MSGPPKRLSGAKFGDMGFHLAPPPCTVTALYLRTMSVKMIPVINRTCAGLRGPIKSRQPYHRQMAGMASAVHVQCLSTGAKYEALEEWIASPPTHKIMDGLNAEHLSDMYITLPTRDGTRRPYEAPLVGAPLPYGHHLGFFHARRAEPYLRADGTDEDISPPAPFTKRMWAGGKITWNNTIPFLVGKPSEGKSSVAKVEKKGFDQGKPMLFVTQKIDFYQEGQNEPSVVEERSHVYFHEEVFSNRKKVFDREVKGLPSSVDFSFKYTPTPVTLFRYSALMFNAHKIHLDKEYCQEEEGYPERIVHGPLTAQMLLETLNFHHPEVKVRSFDYRATNPMFVNRQLTVSGTWLDGSTVQVWCSDDNEVVGMTGKIQIQ